MVEGHPHARRLLRRPIIQQIGDIVKKERARPSLKGRLILDSQKQQKAPRSAANAGIQGIIYPFAPRLGMS